MSEELDCDAEKDLTRPTCVDREAPAIFSSIQGSVSVDQGRRRLGVAVMFVSSPHDTNTQ